MKRQDTKKRSNLQVLLPGSYIVDSMRYIKEFGEVGHVIEFKMYSLYVCFKQEDTVILESPNGIQGEILILSKFYEGDLLSVRGIALKEKER